ncbi:hypothetical protein N752_18355 [Desulforamulus aquiferis]|nr:amidohydrolase family protein [Desulforamulus aquiferis]RYD03711.1 hypothetical protein N752_18355 [Desulforamulus aquiferis]
MARDFPELKIIISHGGYPWVNEAIFVAQRNKNVYLDISEYELTPQSEAYIQAANTLISDKLLYASAHPFVDFRESLKIFDNLPLDREVREKVMYKNAAKLLFGKCDNLPAADTHSAAKENMEDLIIQGVIKELAKRGLVS